MNPLEQLNTANDAYHEAVERILNLDVDVTTKADFGALVNRIFKLMNSARDLVEENME